MLIRDAIGANMARLKGLGAWQMERDGVVITYRRRKGPFVQRPKPAPPGIVEGRYYELVLSNGCPHRCAYCYLQLTFKGNKEPTLYTNPWSEVQPELDAVRSGVFTTGELADSLAIVPPLLPAAIDYFSNQSTRHLFLLTKSTNISVLESFKPCDQVSIGFSVNAPHISARYEHGAPHPYKRLEAAFRLKELGWRVHIRIDPIILEGDFFLYNPLCLKIRELEPETISVGTLRSFKNLFKYNPRSPRRSLVPCFDGRMRYPFQMRLDAYRRIADWLGRIPYLTKETERMWKALGWDEREAGGDHYAKLAGTKRC